MAKIYEPRGKAREYSPLALNYYKGCSHLCKYCYAKPLLSRFNKNYEHEKVASDIDFLKVRNEIKNTCKKYANSKDQVLLNFTSDPYNSLELELGQENGLTYYALTQLLENNIPVSILSKAGIAILRDIDLFKKFGNKIVVGQSLTMCSDESSMEWEAGAAIPEDRLLALNELKQAGINTWASFEPVIDMKESLTMLIAVCQGNLTNFVKIGKLNNYKGLDKQINWHDFLIKAVHICNEFNMPFYIKHDLQKYKPDCVHLTANETNQDFFNVK